MVVLNTVRQNYYQDSMKLMQISKELSSLSGINKASAIMATEANLIMLREAGLIKKFPDSISANDLIIAVEGETKKTAQDAINSLDTFLLTLQSAVEENIEYKSFDSAYSALNRPNMAIISVPGEFAKLEVARAINHNIHTFLFSDNLDVEEEIELKQRAIERGLLMMGPGCGTAIINGTCLGFANIVRRGPIGVIAAAGTGLQEVVSLVHNWGLGITHGIGVGGRDLSEKVGGLMTVEAIKHLQRDKNTKFILLVSKPASGSVIKKIVETARKAKKPFAMCFLGDNSEKIPEKNIYYTKTLEELSLLAVKLADKKKASLVDIDDNGWRKFAKKYIKTVNPKQKYIRGLFSGAHSATKLNRYLPGQLGTYIPMHLYRVNTIWKIPIKATGIPVLTLGKRNLQ